MHIHACTDEFCAAAAWVHNNDQLILIDNYISVYIYILAGSSSWIKDINAGSLQAHACMHAYYIHILFCIHI